MINLLVKKLLSIFSHSFISWFENWSLLTIFFLINYQLYSQSNFEIQKIINSDKSVDTIILEADSVLSIFEDSKRDSLYYIYQEYAYWLFDVGKIKEAIYFENKAFSQSCKLKIIDSSFAQRSAVYLGFYYGRNNQLLESINFYNKAILFNYKSSYLVWAYRKLGETYFGINDYFNAVKYWELAGSLLIGQDKIDLEKLAMVYGDLALAYEQLRDRKGYLKGIAYGIAADSISSLSHSSSLNSYRIKKQIANLYSKNETVDFIKSEDYFNQALSIAIQLNDSSRIRSVYYGLGVLFNESDSVKSIIAFNNALTFTNKNDSLGQSVIHYGIGLTYGIIKNPQKSIVNLLHGLKYLTGAGLNDINSNFDSILSSTVYKENLLGIFKRLSEAYLLDFEENGTKNSLIQSIKFFDFSDRMIDNIRSNSREFKSKLIWRKISSDIYGKAIRACFLRNDIEKAFYYMEKNKAMLLTEELSEISYYRSLSLPNYFLKKEGDLKSKIVSNNIKLENSSGLSHKVIDSLKKENVDCEIQLLVMKDSLILTDPTSKLRPNVIPFKEVKNQMNDDEIVINYHLSEDDGYGIYSNRDRGYVIIISKDTSLFFEISGLIEFKEELRDVIGLQKKPFRTVGDIEQYSELSNRVLKILMPIENFTEFFQSKRIILIPDSDLSFLSFEALSISRDSLDYFINYNQCCPVKIQID